MAAETIETDYISALYTEGNKLVDEAIAEHQARVREYGTIVEDDGVRILRYASGGLLIDVEYEEIAASGANLDLTYRVHFYPSTANKAPEIHADRINPQTREQGSRTIPLQRHQEVAGELLKVLLQQP